MRRKIGGKASRGVVKVAIFLQISPRVTVRLRLPGG
jgi:hypothetical protein